VVKVSRRERDLDETLTAKPGYALVGVVRAPHALEAGDRLLDARNTGK
jgi:hypothetical protein